MSELKNDKIINDSESVNGVICHRFGCLNTAIKKINVSAGTFGIITLKLCNKCFEFFKENQYDIKPEANPKKNDLLINSLQGSNQQPRLPMEMTEFAE